jgi:hypothetical protein
MIRDAVKRRLPRMPFTPGSFKAAAAGESK